MPQFFISGNVPSSKNSKVATSKGVFHSATVRKYLQACGIKSYSVSRREVAGYVTRPNVIAPVMADIARILSNVKPPVIMGFHFIRDSRRKFDFCNAIQIIADLMVAHGVIADDNMDYFIPMPIQVNNLWYSVDKAHAGVIIEI